MSARKYTRRRIQCLRNTFSVGRWLNQFANAKIMPNSTEDAGPYFLPEEAHAARGKWLWRQRRMKGEKIPQISWLSATRCGFSLSYVAFSERQGKPQPIPCNNLGLCRWFSRYVEKDRASSTCRRKRHSWYIVIFTFNSPGTGGAELTIRRARRDQLPGVLKMLGGSKKSEVRAIKKKKLYSSYWTKSRAADQLVNMILIRKKILISIRNSYHEIGLEHDIYWLGCKIPKSSVKGSPTNFFSKCFLFFLSSFETGIELANRGCLLVQPFRTIQNWKETPAFSMPTERTSFSLKQFFFQNFNSLFAFYRL